MNGDRDSNLSNQRYLLMLIALILIVLFGTFYHFGIFEYLPQDKTDHLSRVKHLGLQIIPGFIAALLAFVALYLFLEQRKIRTPSAIMLEELSKAVSEIGEHIREREKELDREFIYQTLPDDCWLELREGSQAILRVLLRRESSKHVIRGRSKVRSDQISGLLEDLEKKVYWKKQYLITMLKNGG